MSTATPAKIAPAGIVRHAGSHSMMSASLLMPNTRPRIPVPNGVRKTAIALTAAATARCRAYRRSHITAVNNTAATTRPPMTTAPCRLAHTRKTTGSQTKRRAASSATTTTRNRRLNTCGRSDATISVTGNVRNISAPRRSTGPTMSRHTNAKAAVTAVAMTSASNGIPPTRCAAEKIASDNHSWSGQA